MSEVILINLTGADRPGITRDLSAILASHDVRVLDIGQAVIHDTLTLGILVEVPPESESHPVLKDVLFKAHEWDLQARFTPVGIEEYERWVAAQGQPRYIMTLIGSRLTARHLEGLGDVATRHGLNIDNITRLSGRVSMRIANEQQRSCVELSLRGTPDDASALRGELLELAQELDVDIAFQVDDVYRRNRRLVAFDMDSTLIQTEVIDELAAEAGVGEEVAAITESAMNGELDFRESLERRVALLEGLDASVLEKIATRLPLTPGAERLIRTLRSLDYRTAILSGGFDFFGRHLQQRLGIDFVFANELEIVDGRLTGRVKGEIVDGVRKAALLRQLAEREGLRLEQTIAVGDGANDLPMLDAAGLGIAFHAKPKVRASAEQVISNLGLDGILYLIGMSDREVQQA
ncbi:MAG: phosphoserine phosphatase SerB [Deltaproteobacteria bacterium]|jgi:phosphoserine phosphatase|nr:phosphoserine phosphatase SerB [Deltaproteobacteria bacterium]